LKIQIIALTLFTSIFLLGLWGAVTAPHIEWIRVDSEEEMEKYMNETNMVYLCPQTKGAYLGTLAYLYANYPIAPFSFAILILVYIVIIIRNFKTTERKDENP